MTPSLQDSLFGWFNPKMVTPSKPSDKDGKNGIHFYRLGLPLGKRIS